jgi:2-hydroxychromene-2-carboxylate isomerase
VWNVAGTATRQRYEQAPVIAASDHAPDAAFYFDLFSPEAYLAAERVIRVLGAPARWQPVLARDLAAAESFEGFRCAEEEAIFRSELERRSAAQGLQPVVWPDPFPFDSERAMRVAIFAAGIGKLVAYSLAAFRQAFAGGRSLAVSENVLIAAAACEMHPAAVQRAAERGSLGRSLAQATERAVAAGVRDVPAVRIGELVFHGPDAPERAGEAVAQARATVRPVSGP